MTDLTIGQRIAAQRKQLGLSQEALGEKMGVSRQAISKWESDAAVPEIDKFIAMSRLFGVSVGWLLGVEDPAPEETQPEDFTDRQLHMIEEIVRGCTRTAPEPPRKRWGAILAAAAIVVLGLGLLGVRRDIRKLNNRLNAAEQVATGAESAASINDSRLSALEAAAPAQAAQSADVLLAEYSFDITPHDEDARAEVVFTAVPVRWQEGDQGYLSIRLGEQELIFSCRQGGAFLTAAAELAIEDGYGLCFTQVHADGSREQQPLSWPELDNLRSALTVVVKSDLGRGRLEEGDLVLRDYSFTVAMPTLGYVYGSQYWETIDLVLRSAGEEIGRFNLMCYADGTGEDIAYSSEITFCQEEITFKAPTLTEGEGLELWLQAELGSGLSDSVLVDSWRIGQNGLE